MTLVTLAVILGYFTRRHESRGFANLSSADLLRTVLLMFAAVPIAVLTNAARVTGTGVLTYYYGKQAVEGTWHDASGWMVYVVALALLIGANYLLQKALRGGAANIDTPFETVSARGIQRPSILPLIAAILIGGTAVNWLTSRGEAQPPREPLTQLSTTLGEWRQYGSEIKFSEQTESVLRTTDYTMRDYMTPDGQPANVYVGYYASQRSGATYPALKTVCPAPAG